MALSKNKREQGLQKLNEKFGKQAVDDFSILLKQVMELAYHYLINRIEKDVYGVPSKHTYDRSTNMEFLESVCIDEIHKYYNGLSGEIYLDPEKMTVVERKKSKDGWGHHSSFDDEDVRGGNPQSEEDEFNKGMIEWFLGDEGTSVGNGNPFPRQATYIWSDLQEYIQELLGNLGSVGIRGTKMKLVKKITSPRLK